MVGIASNNRLVVFIGATLWGQKGFWEILVKLGS